jgi:hypothetical protein
LQDNKGTELSLPNEIIVGNVLVVNDFKEFKEYKEFEDMA